jgi:putative long chain acyl-CoA synthase
MLLSRVHPDAIGMGEGVLRGVFEPGDAWLETGDLFRVDGDGDFWLVDHLASVIRTRSGVVWSGPIQDALGDLDAIALAVAYGIERADGGAVPSAAVTLREGRLLDIHELERVLADLGDAGIPWVVRVVDRIPLTTWYRPVTGPLERDGIPDPSDPPSSWYWDPRKGGYRPLSKAATGRLEAGRG